MILELVFLSKAIRIASQYLYQNPFPIESAGSSQYVIASSGAYHLTTHTSVTLSLQRSMAS
jgi:hypothetical protein